MSGYNPYASGHGHQGDGMQQMDMSTNAQIMAGHSLDDIVSQNAKLMRRQSMPQGFHPSQQQPQQPQPMDADDPRRMSMMEFTGTSPTGPLESYQFSLSNSEMVDATAYMAASQANPAMQSRQSSTGGPDMAIDSGFGPTGSYMPMMPSTSSFQSPAPLSNIDMDLNSPYINTPMHMSSLGYNSPNIDRPMPPIYSHNSYHGMMTSPHHTSVPSHMYTQSSETGGNPNPSKRPSLENSHSRSSNSQTMQTTHQQSRQPTPQRQNSRQPQLQRGHSGFKAQPQNPQPGSRQDVGMDRGRNLDNAGAGRSPDPSKYNPNNQGFNWPTPEGGWPSTMTGKPHMHSQYKNAYSSTGFDMLGVLMRVATRPNPEINIGSVDLSCAFVVCDAEKDDFPIVYCSDNFERLTGYTRHMILGRNCRFLQSPDGNVEAGVRRKYVDDDSVLYLKNMINLRREAQISLINYRRGGQPFMNLLTMIPISWDTDQVKFFVGFQVDLVEQPNAVTDRNPDGTYAINYQRGMTMPRYVMNAPESTANRGEFGQTIPRDDVSAILSTIGTGESDFAKRMWDKVLLENTDDVIHVLSLKGLFQWISPSASKVLEYEPGEIIGTALSSICHPSDIVPVTRDLKDTSTGASVNVVFRIRRKNSGYMWFEGHGSLHTEQGKGRKSIIMVGRERPVYALNRNELSENNGVGENELWTKMSTSGMFLFVSSNVRQLLDRQPDELVGVSIQSLMRADSKAEFGRVLEHARTGKKASVRHEMINRRGHVLQAFTTLYPGDASEGQKPTFIVAQTRLIKHQRGNSSSRPALSQRGSESALSGRHTPATPMLMGDNTPQSLSQLQSTDGAAPTYSGQNGLLLGRQDGALASEDNLFDELKTTKSSSWQYEIRQLEKKNRMLAEEVQSLLASKKKRKRRKGAGQMQKDCANCHTRVTPEWRRGPSGQRDLCNSCGLRWAKLVSQSATSSRVSADG
jgi:PAS domain S-box-containing protein